MQSLNEMHCWMAPLRSCMLCTPRYKQCSAQRAFYGNFVHYVQIQDIPYDQLEIVPINIPPKIRRLPPEFINIQPHKRGSRSKFHQPKVVPPLDFINQRKVCLQISSTQFPKTCIFNDIWILGSVKGAILYYIAPLIV